MSTFWKGLILAGFLFLLATLIVNCVPVENASYSNGGTATHPNYKPIWYEYTITFNDGGIETFCATSADATFEGDQSLIKFYIDTRLVAAYTDFDHFISKENSLCESKYANNY